MALLQLAPPTTAPATAGGPQPQPGPAGPASTPAAAADATGTSPRGAVVWVSLAVIAVALVGCGVLNWRVNPVPFTVPAGVGVFAVFYAVTQGLERLLEPISALVYKTNDAVTDRNRTLAQALSTSPAGNRQTAIQKAAAAQATLDQRRADRAVIFWAAATVLAMAVSAALGLYLLHAVGLPEGSWRGGPFSAQGLRRWVDLLVTGLAVGGGTKPLHDLISNLQASKEAKKDPPQVISS
jgi:hypothetical protein